LARFWQSCKILATWQDFGNVAKYMQELIHALGNQARFWQSGEILAVRKDFGNLATGFLKIFCSILPNVT